MFITKKKHKEIIEKLKKEHFDEQKKIISELEQAKCLKEILQKFSINIDKITCDQYSIISSSADFPDTVLQYTDDILGGRVIKQEGTKCIVIDKHGKVKTGLTKQNVDDGYTYKLVREQV